MSRFKQYLEQTNYNEAFQDNPNDLHMEIHTNKDAGFAEWLEDELDMKMGDFVFKKTGINRQNVIYSTTGTFDQIVNFMKDLNEMGVKQGGLEGYINKIIIQS